jgi:hypothetical protein
MRGGGCAIAEEHVTGTDIAIRPTATARRGRQSTIGQSFQNVSKRLSPFNHPAA